MIVGQDSLPYLKQLKDDLEPFNPDQVEDVKRYVSKTGLHTGLIETISQVREVLMNENNPDLNKKYEIIRNDLMDHVDRRILRVIGKNSIYLNDYWAAIESQAKNSDEKQSCQEASFHIDDIIFDIEELVKSGLKRAHTKVADEVKELLSCLDDKYFPLLIKNNSESKEVKEMQKNVVISLEELERLLREKNYKDAGKTLATLKEQLSTF